MIHLSALYLLGSMLSLVSAQGCLAPAIRDVLLTGRICLDGVCLDSSDFQTIKSISNSSTVSNQTTLPILNSTHLCIGSACWTEADIQQIKNNPIAQFVCTSTGSCLNATDISIIKSLPQSVNSTQHCIGPDCLISTDLSVLKNIGQVVNSSLLCIGNTCLNSTDITTLKSLIQYPIIVQELSLNSTVSTLAGSGTVGSTDGAASTARFNEPRGIAYAADGTIYIGDTHNHVIRKISPDLNVSTLAGSAGLTGTTDGTGSAARFNNIRGIVMGPDGNIYVTDAFNHRIRMVTPAGVVSTVVGTTVGYRDGNATVAQFNSPRSIAFLSNGSMLVAEYSNHRIRMVSPSRIVTTLAGSGSAASTNGNGISASFNSPWGITVDQNDQIFVTEYIGKVVRRITVDGQVTTLAGSGLTGSADGQGTSAQFRGPLGIVANTNGTLYVAEEGHLIRKIKYDGTVTTVAGSGGTLGFADGVGQAARFNQPHSLAISPNGTLFVTDSLNSRIRRISN